MKIDTCLKSLRLSKKMTQKELGQRLSLSASTISSYELGVNSPSYDILVKYADIFHVSTDYILGRETSVTPIIDADGLSDYEIKAVQALVDGLRHK